MNLVTRFLAQRRDKLLMRLGCWLVCFSLILGLMLPQQRAEALVAELSMTAVASVAAAYLASCGLGFATQGMDKDALVNSIQRLINEFLDTELGGMSIQDWLGNIWDLVSIAGKLVLGRPLTNELMGFAQWVAQKYGTQVGMNIVYEGLDQYPVLEGSGYALHWAYPYSADVIRVDTISPGNRYDINLAVKEPGRYVLFNIPDPGPILSGNYFYFYHGNVTSVKPDSSFSADGGTYYYYTITEEDISRGALYVNFSGRWTGGEFSGVVGTVFPLDLSFGSYFAYADAVSEILGIDRAESMSYIPDGITAEQGIALDVGAATTMDLDLVLQGVLDDVLAGELTSTMAIADEAAEPIDPPAEEIPDVDDLGLPALGAALTSRFPFSIPWDFFRAVQLLAAPAKAPYFEVDFMEPLADEVGGWKGSTKVILDFSQYAIIGQVSRWTSTIGFCLMLATATKRLIWTA